MNEIKERIANLEKQLKEIIDKLYDLDTILISQEEVNMQKARYNKQSDDINKEIQELKIILEVQVINKINSLTDAEITSLCNERKEIISEKLEKLREVKNTTPPNEEFPYNSLSVAISNYGASSDMAITFYDGISKYLNEANMKYIKETFYDKLSEEVKRGLEYLAFIKSEIDVQISRMRSNGISFKLEDVVNSVMDVRDAIYGTRRNFVAKFYETFHKRNNLGYGLSCILKYQRLTKIATDLDIDLSQLPTVDLNDIKNYGDNTAVSEYIDQLRKLISDDCSRRKHQYDDITKEKEALNREILQLDKWIEKPNAFRRDLKDKFKVSEIEKSSEYKDLKAVSQADKELNEVGQKYGFDAKEMNSDAFSSMLNTANEIDGLNSNIARLESTISNINIISQKLSSLTNARELTQDIYSVNDLNNKKKEQDDLINRYGQQNEKLETEKKELSGKFVLGKAKKLAELDSQIETTSSKISQAENTRYSYISQAVTIKNKAVEKIINIIKTECKITSLDNVDISVFIEKACKVVPIDKLISAIQEKLFSRQSEIRGEIRTINDKINTLKGSANNVSVEDIKQIDKNRRLLESSNHVSVIGYYNQVNSTPIDANDFQSRLEENIDQMIESSGRKL